jgi:predicted outer membrane repeat protein
MMIRKRTRTNRPLRTSSQLKRDRRRLRFESLEDRLLLAITVDTLVDEADGNIVDGDVSLRDAIAVATSGETIDFSVTGTIQLDSSLGALAIDKNLTIEGPGANQLTIDGGQSVRGFIIDDGNATGDKNVTISGLTITHGHTIQSDGSVNAGRGGAILSFENLSLAQVHLVDNEAGADGGGVWIRFGDLNVVESTLSGNIAGFKGGAIYARDGDSSITSSTISGNSVDVGTSSGGGIYARNGLHSISHSTITGNSADLAGGVRGVDSIDHSIVAGNTATAQN